MINLKQVVIHTYQLPEQVRYSTSTNYHAKRGHSSQMQYKHTGAAHMQLKKNITYNWFYTYGKTTIVYIKWMSAELVQVLMLTNVIIM